MINAKVEINRDLCMGAGECVYSAPQTFELDDSSKAVVKSLLDSDDAIKAAVRGCPNFAIRLVPLTK